MPFVEGSYVIMGPSHRADCRVHQLRHVGVLFAYLECIRKPKEIIHEIFNGLHDPLSAFKRPSVAGRKQECQPIVSIQLPLTVPSAADSIVLIQFLLSQTCLEYLILLLFVSTVVVRPLSNFKIFKFHALGVEYFVGHSALDCMSSDSRTLATPARS